MDNLRLIKKLSVFIIRYYPHNNMLIVSIKEARMSKEQLDTIRYRFKIGEFTYDSAQLLAEEPLKIMNTYMKQRANDFGVKHHSISFTSYIR